MDQENKSFYDRNKFKIWIVVFLLVVAGISVASLVLVTEPKKPYTESLYSDVLNPATFKYPSTGNHELLYSYPLNSGQGNKSGFFTVVMTGSFDIPNISFDVRDQSNTSIISNPTRVGKTTIIKFNGKPDSTTINLYINPGASGIQLTSINITLDR